MRNRLLYAAAAAAAALVLRFDDYEPIVGVELFCGIIFNYGDAAGKSCDCD